MEVAARLRAADVVPAEAEGAEPGAPKARSSAYLGISPLVCQRRASLQGQCCGRVVKQQLGQED